MISAPLLNCVGFAVELQSFDDLNSAGGSGATFGFQLLPDDPIGTFNLTLTNVVVGSRVHVEKQDGAVSFYDEIATTSSVLISLDTYAPGSSYNDLRVKVRKASSSPAYKPFETLSTAIVGSQSIYVGQILDE